MPSHDVHIIWDLGDDETGTVRHIAEHGLSQQEVDEVLTNPNNPTSESESSGEPVAFGWTATSRHIVVVWEHVLDDPWTIRPMTAYGGSAPEPFQKAPEEKMKISSVSKKIAKSPEQLGRIQSLREKYKSRPAPEELLAGGEYTAPVPLGVYLKIKQLMHQLKLGRSKAKLSLADLAERTKIDRGYLSKLENMQQANTTLETVSRIAEALGLEICFSPVSNGRKSRAKLKSGV